MTDLTAFVLIMGAGLAAGCGLFAFALHKNGQPSVRALAAFLAGAASAFVGAKFFFLLADLGADLTVNGLGAVIDPNPEKLSFVGGCIGFVSGAALALRLSGGCPGKALDLFAVPGCVTLLAARLAQGALGGIGCGDYVSGTAWAVPLLSVADEWGDRYLAVFFLEAAAALLTGLWAFLTRHKKYDLSLFSRTVYALCVLQLFLEMLKTTWVPLVISFIRLDQVLCAFLMLFMLLPAVKKTGRKAPVVIFFICIAVNGITQYIMDKPYLFIWVFPEDIETWIGENLYPLGLGIMALTVAGALVPVLKRKKEA